MGNAMTGVPLQRYALDRCLAEAATSAGSGPKAEAEGDAHASPRGKLPLDVQRAPFGSVCMELGKATACVNAQYRAVHRSLYFF